MLPSNSSLMLARMRLREDNTCPGGAPCRHPALPFPLQMRGQECPRLQESILCSRWVAAGVMARVHVRHVRRIEPVQGVRIDLQAHGVPIGDNFVAPADTRSPVSNRLHPRSSLVRRGLFTYTSIGDRQGKACQDRDDPGGKQRA